MSATHRPRLTARRRRGLELLLDDIADATDGRYAKRIKANNHVRLDFNERAQVRDALAYLRELVHWHQAKGDIDERITKTGDRIAGVGI